MKSPVGGNGSVRASGSDNSSGRKNLTEMGFCCLYVGARRLGAPDVQGSAIRQQGADFKLKAAMTAAKAGHLQAQAARKCRSISKRGVRGVSIVTRNRLLSID